jgi:hypothetical protein
MLAVSAGYRLHSFGPVYTWLWHPHAALKVRVEMRRERVPCGVVLKPPNEIRTETCGEDDLHVLLRHRLLLQAEVGEGAVAVQPDSKSDDLAAASAVKGCLRASIPAA